MSEVCYQVIAPEGLRETMLAGRDQLRAENPHLEVEAGTTTRGWFDQAITVMGDLANMAGLITFVDWSVNKYLSRRKAQDSAKDSTDNDGGESIKFVIIGPDGLPRQVHILPSDDAPQIRQQITQALTPGHN